MIYVNLNHFYISPPFRCLLSLLCKLFSFCLLSISTVLRRSFLGRPSRWHEKTLLRCESRRIFPNRTATKQQKIRWQFKSEKIHSRKQLASSHSRAACWSRGIVYKIVKFCAKKLFLQDYFNVSIRNAPLDFVGRVDAICHRDFRWMTNNWRDARAAWWWCNADRRNEIVEQKSDSRTVCSWASSS